MIPQQNSEEVRRTAQSLDDKDKLSVRVLRNGYLLSTNFGKFAYMNVPDLLREIEKILKSGRDEFQVK